MPKISEFYGILIRMYYEDHGIPHIHAKYGDEEASFAIETGKLLKGEFPLSKERMVRKWIKMHKRDLVENWQITSAGKMPRKIEPLQ